MLLRSTGEQDLEGHSGLKYQQQWEEEWLLNHPVWGW